MGKEAPVELAQHPAGAGIRGVACDHDMTWNDDELDQIEFGSVPGRPAGSIGSCRRGHGCTTRWRGPARPRRQRRRSGDNDLGEKRTGAPA